MRKYVVTIAVLAALAVPVTAVAGTRSDARYVENHVTTYWHTSDHVAVDDAQCFPWWHHGGQFRREFGEWFGSAWNCHEYDDSGRVFWVHVRVRQGGGLAPGVEYRCNDVSASKMCPVN
jgi:hypothetical protein